MPYLSHKISVPLVGIAVAARGTVPLTSVRHNAASPTRTDRRWRAGTIVIACLPGRLLFHIPALRDHFLAVIAEAINDAGEFGDAFTTGRTAVIGIGFRVGDERRDFAVLGAADPDAARSARVVAVALNALRL